MHPPVRLRRALALASSLACIAAPAAAQVRSFQLTSDNDAYNFWIPFDVRPDNEYSNGLRLAVEFAGAPVWKVIARELGPCAREGDQAAPADPEAGCASTTVEIGQQLYAPRIDSPTPVRGQRPFAGWLYAAATGRVVDGPVRHTVGLEVGVTGGPSLGEATMEHYHAIFGFWNPKGWSHQLGFEPGVVLRYGVEHRVAELRVGGMRLADVAVDAGGSVGNVHTHARAGFRLRAGYDLPHLWMAGRARGTSLYASAGAEGRFVVRNLFLDGNTFSSQPARVQREPLVASRGWGVGLASGPFGAEFRVSTRTREYREEPGGHPVSTIELTWRR